MAASRAEHMTTEELGAHPPERCVALLPVGSTEPHGPHLALSTDTAISVGVAAAACVALRARGDDALVFPAVPYGVTDYAAGFPGAVSVSPTALAAFLEAITRALLEAGYAQVCLINSHLEPAHDTGVRDVAAAFPAGRVSVASPLTRRWARTLSEEFKRGACHAGQYETSLLLHLAPDLVRPAIASTLDDLDLSLSEGIRAGRSSFRAMGLGRAYTGSPRSATAAEGKRLVDLLVAMVLGEIDDARARAATAGAPPHA